MSTTEDKSNNNDEDNALSEDLVNLNTGSEGDVASIPLLSPKTGDENVGAISKAKPVSPSSSISTIGGTEKQAGDTTIEKSKNLVKSIESVPEISKGSSDHAATKDADVVNIDTETTSLLKGDECDKNDDTAQFKDTDDSLELKWDDDEENTQFLDAKDTTYEEQLLEDSKNDESCEIFATNKGKEDSEDIGGDKTNINEENSEIIIKDVLKENNDETLKDKPTEEAEITTEPESCTVIDNPIMKDVVKVDTEELLLKDTKESSLDSPNVDISSENGVLDEDIFLAETAAAEDDNTKVDKELEEEDRLLEDTDTNVETSEIIPDDKLLEETDSIKKLDTSEMDVSMDEKDEKEDEPSQAMDVDIEDQETANEIDLQVSDKMDQPITDKKDNEPANRCSDADLKLVAVDKPTNTSKVDTVIENNAELEKLLSENVTEESIKDIDNISDINEQVGSNTACSDNSCLQIKTNDKAESDVYTEKELSKNITKKNVVLDKNLDSNIDTATSCLDDVSLQTNNPKNALESEKILAINVKEDNSDTITDSSTVICLDNSKNIQNDVLHEKQKTEALEKLLAENVIEDNPKILDVTTENLSILDDSLIHIKTDHALHKPDVMLEIPTQEIIDIDAELSMTIDHSPLEMSEENITDIVHEETVDKTVDVTVKENAVEQVSTMDLTANQTEDIVDGVPVEQSSRQETIEESMEKMFAEDEPTVTQEIECIPTTSQAPDIQPVSSSNMSPDTDEIPEISDSLGLLAESSGRLMEDDEEPEDDDDDDFDQDESSNQVSAEQSEDSNAPHSETEPARDQEEKEIDTPEPKGEEFQFTICNIESSLQEKENTDDAVETEISDVEVNPYAEQDETLNAIEDSEENSQDVVNKSMDQPMDEDTVRLSDTSDNEEKADEKILLDEPEIITEESQDTEEPTATSKTPTKSSPVKSSPLTLLAVKSSPAKLMKLEIKTLQADQVVNFVDLEESSSSEDDIQDITKSPEPEIIEDDKPDEEGVTKVNIPSGIDIMCTSGGSTSEMVTKAGEVVICGIPKPPPLRPARLNTGEVTIKTVSIAEPLVIPETTAHQLTQSDAPAPKLGLEIFSLDSDDEDSSSKDYPENPATPPITPESAPASPGEQPVGKCMNCLCPRLDTDEPETELYDTGRKGRILLCLQCAQASVNRSKKLVEDIKNFTPILDMDLQNRSQELVEISDSDSEGDENSPSKRKDTIGEKTAKFLEENLAAIMNETWKKYDMDTRIQETRLVLDDELEKLEEETKELGRVFNECQAMTDYLRRELYASFEEEKHEVPAISIVDKDGTTYTGFEVDTTIPETITRSSKRRMSSSSDMPAKRPAIPLGYAPIDAEGSKDPKMTAGTDRLDDDKDISVVKLSAEAAPADLPPPGEISRPPLRVGMPVFAMKNAFGPWLKGKVLDVLPKTVATTFTLCRVKFDHKTKTNGKVLPARCIAYPEPADVRMTIGTRLIALFKDSNKRESYYSGVVAEIPNPVNNYRYLVFFDDGYAQYVQHAYTRLVCESSPLVWEEVHPFSREFVREYLIAYPERPMVRLHEGQSLKTEWNGKWWSSRVTRVDASLAQVLFVGDGRREWIYRGSTRLAPLYLELRAAERHRPRPMPRSKAQPRFNMPYVEYTRSDEPQSNKQQDTQVPQQTNEEIRRQRAVAKKSTSLPPAAPPPPQPVPENVDNALASRVVYYTPKHAVRPYKMVPHKCGPKCKRSDVLTLKDLRTYNPLAKPLLSGWERQIVRFKGHKEVMYRAPCGRRVRSMHELHTYLRAVDSELPVDLFDFHPATHCLAEFVHNKCLVGKKDLSHGKENVPVPCVNYYDDSLPEFCSYNTERTPTAGVPLNLDPEFLCGCDCTDDCEDKTKCACWKMTLEGARTIGLDGPNVGYVHKRLPEPLPSGIYECNSRCKCKHTCLNRVAQHPLQLKLQVFKTVNRGWGIRALNDVPKGSFLCVYAGNLLTDATANLDGLNEGDEYLAELDYIEVVEQMKEGYEEDIPDADKKLDRKEIKGDATDSDEEPSSSDEDDTASKTDKEDDDFRPGYIGLGVMEFNKRLRRREKVKKEKEETEEEKEKEAKDSNAEEDCITISDDEEVREPSRFTVQAGMGANEFISKYRSVRSLFGKDEACYIMDAKVQGNIGRYLNHSCSPNVFVQNVFVDTHDPRFPWVAFFALSHIKAGTELTWNYNYDVGSVPGKILYCHCGAANCRGRLL